MTNKKRIVGIATIVIIVAIAGIWYLSASKTPESDNVQTTRGAVSQADLEKATASLKTVVDTANRLYGIVDGTSFNFHARDSYGPSGNFGLVKYVSNVKAEKVVDEQMVRFTGTTDNDNAEVDAKTGKVVSLHRSANYGFCDKPQCDVKTPVQLESIVRTFLNEVDPSFTQIESTLTFEKNGKTGRPEGSNYFFTWNDTAYQNELPEGIETDRAPFIQVGITSSGFIFNYSNTVSLYRDALQKLRVAQ